MDERRILLSLSFLKLKNRGQSLRLQNSSLLKGNSGVIILETKGSLLTISEYLKTEVCTVTF